MEVSRGVEVGREHAARPALTTSDRLVTTMTRLAADIQARALTEGDHGSAFAALSADALQRAALHQVLAPRDILRWLATTDAIPRQSRSDESFGQPSMTLFQSHRFRIEALFWHTATTAIHQHGFAGAFMVLSGSSLQSTFAFQLTDRGDGRIMTGAVALQSSELLRSGSVRRIDPGDALIHSLFHLDTPSVTLVVRTHAAPEHGPEYVYYPPGIAVDPAASDRLARKRLQALDLLLRIDSSDLEDLAREIVEHSSPDITLQVLMRLRLAGSRAYGAVRDAAARRHPRYADAMAAAVEEERRRALITAMRRSVLDPHHRLFLALLMNVPTREPILALLRRELPERDPADLVLQWTREIAAVAPLGTELLAPLFASSKAPAGRA